MIHGITALGEVPTDGLPDSLDNSTANPYWLFFDDHYADNNFVLVANPPSLTGTPGEMPYALGEYALGEYSATDLTVRGPYRWAWKALETDSSDFPASTVIQSYLIEPFNYSSGIPMPGEFSGVGQTSFGYISVANTGDLDDAAVNNSWEGRTVELYHGGTAHPGRPTENTLDFKDYKRLYSMQVGNITLSDTQIDIGIRDPGFRLESPIQENKYLGTGGYEGGESIKGQAKPYALGVFREVPAVLIDDVNFIYQFHDGSGCTIDTVRQGGGELTADGDSTDLASESMSANTYKTDLSRGLIRLGTEPDGTVTVSGTGVGGVTISSIIQHIVERAGVNTAGNSFLEYGAYTAGYWCGTSFVNVASVASSLIGSVDGWYIFDRDGNLAIGEHDNASSSSAVLTFEGRQDSLTDGVVTISDLTREMGPRNVWRYTLGYRKYWSFGNVDEELLNNQPIPKRRRRRRRYIPIGTVSPDEREDLDQEFRTVDPAENRGTKGRFEDAMPVEINTFIDDEAQTSNLAERLVARDSKARGIYSFTTDRFQFWANPGDIVNLYHDRYGLDSGKVGRILSIDDDAASGRSAVRVLVVEN